MGGGGPPTQAKTWENGSHGPKPKPGGTTPKENKMGRKKKEAVPAMATYRCGICTYEKEVEVGSRNVPCPMCRNTMAVKLYPVMENYIVGLGTTASGRSTVDIGDEIADSLRGLTVEEVIEKTAKVLDAMDDKFLAPKFRRNRDAFTGDTEEFLTAKYVERDLNPGMIRMNCGNLIRNAHKRKSGE